MDQVRAAKLFWAWFKCSSGYGLVLGSPFVIGSFCGCQVVRLQVKSFDFYLVAFWVPLLVNMLSKLIREICGF